MNILLERCCIDLVYRMTLEPRNHPSGVVMMGLSRVHTLSLVCVVWVFSSSKDVETCEEGVYFADEDGDGFGSPYVSTKACKIPNGLWPTTLM